MLFCRCGCVTKLCSLCLAGSLETKLKSVNFIQVSIQVYFNFTILYSGFRTLGPFLVFFCYVLGTKVGAALPLPMRHKSRSLCLACSLATKRKSQFCKFYSRVSKVTLSPFSGFLGYVLGTKLGCCFAVADATQSHAASAWQTRRPQN